VRSGNNLASSAIVCGGSFAVKVLRADSSKFDLFSAVEFKNQA